MRRYHRSACGLVLALVASACGGKIAGETDPTATRVTGTKTGTPQPPEDGPEPFPPPSDPGPPSTPSTPPSPPTPPPSATPAPFAWAGACPATPSMPEPPVVLPASVDERRAAMIGHWSGIATTPWSAPYEVHLAFEADGHYASRSSSPTAAAFYYGTDLDTDLKTWSLTDLDDNGAARGKIDIAFQYGPSFGLPLWQGVLSGVAVDATHSRLALSFSRSDGYGPVTFDLYRCP